MKKEMIFYAIQRDYNETLIDYKEKMRRYHLYFDLVSGKISLKELNDSF